MARGPSKGRIRSPTALALVAALAGSAYAQLETHTVTFESLPLHSSLASAFDLIGLQMPGAIVDTLPVPPYKHQVGRMIGPANSDPRGRAMAMRLMFARLQTDVRGHMTSSLSPGTFTYTVSAYDDDKHVVQSKSGEARRGMWVPFDLGVKTPRIRWIDIRIVASPATNIAALPPNLPMDVAVDRITMTGAAPPPPARTHAPHLRGLTLAQASRALADSHLVLGSIGEKRARDPSDTVATQKPGAGAPLPRGARVDLTLAPSTVVVPDLSGLSPKDADALLRSEKHGLRLARVTTAFHLGKPGLIFAQDPVSGAAVRPDTEVSVTIASAAALWTSVVLALGALAVGVRRIGRTRAPVRVRARPDGPLSPWRPLRDERSGSVRSIVRVRVESGPWRPVAQREQPEVPAQ